MSPFLIFFFFFFNDTATTEIYTLSLHALFRSRDRISRRFFSTSGSSLDLRLASRAITPTMPLVCSTMSSRSLAAVRSEEHTSELQSRPHLVCRLLLEKKKNKSPHSPAGHRLTI